MKKINQFCHQIRFQRTKEIIGKYFIYLNSKKSIFLYNSVNKEGHIQLKYVLIFNL